MNRSMIRRAGALGAAVATAGTVHALAAGYLAATDPIAALLGHRYAGALVAALGLTAARLFLFFVAPAWAAHFVVKAIARAIYSPK